MSWICPICKTQNEKTWICTCGFDESKNYEKYPILSNISVKPQDILNEKNALKYLCIYAENNNIKKVEEIIKLYPSVLNKNIIKDLWHYNILSYAIHRDWSVNIIGLLLRYGADPNSIDGVKKGEESSYSALGYAMVLKRMEILTFFLENGVNPNYLSCWKNKDRVFSALGYAILNNDMEIVHLLIKNGVNLNGFHCHQKNGNVSALGMLTELENIELAHILLEYGADPNRNQNQIGKYVYSTFGYAILYENLEMLNLFIEYGKFYQNIDGVDDGFKEQLFEDYISNMEFVSELNKRGWKRLIDIQKVNDENVLDCLLSFAKEKDIDNVEKILKSHPEVLLKRVDKNYSILSYAICKEWDSSIIELLLKHGIDPESYRVSGKNQYSALSDAIWNKKNRDVVKILLKYGANPNRMEVTVTEKNTFCKSMLSSAIDDIKMVELLLRYGANPESYRVSKTKYGDNLYSVLSDAIWNKKNVELVKLLLEYGANPNRIEHIFYSNGKRGYENMLYFAIMSARNIEMAKYLLKYGASWDDVVCTNGIEEKVRNYPFEKYINDKQFLTELTKIGWRKK